MTALAFQSATQLVADIKSRRISARELLELYLGRIDRHNPSINAIVVQDRDAARARANAADAALARGEDWGALHGLPMTLKESYDIAGQPSTWGMPERRGHIATRNALCAQSLMSAGANIFGKTNVPLDLADFQSYNAIYGVTGNPWDVTRTPGGSSGGSAAALAAGLTALEMGSDIGGSIRNPAHYCGVFGHKPSWNLLPSTGHNPGDAHTPVDIAVMGPLARSADDLELALRLTAAPDVLDQGGVSYQLRPLDKPVSALRIGVWHSEPICPASAAVRGRIDAVAQALAGQGAHIDTQARPAFSAEHSHQVFGGLLQAALGARAPKAVFDARLARIDQLSAVPGSEHAQLLRQQTMSLNEWTALNEARARLRHAWQAYFADHDFMITPIMPTSAFAHDHGSFGSRVVDVDGQALPYFRQTFWAGLAGVALLPATVIPAGCGADGLPLGVQIIGPMWGDMQTIGLSQRLERLGFAFQAPSHLL